MLKLSSLFLSVLLLAPAPAQERGVVVTNLDNELRRTAHRLNTDLDRIRWARALLRTASELALELAETEDIGRFASYWRYLDRPDAAEQIARLVGELKRRAAATGDAQAHGQLTRNALSLGEGLRQLRPRVADELLENWPEPPLLSAEELERNARQQRQFEERRLMQRFQEDMDGALEELRELEAEGPLLNTRTMAVNELLNRNRTEDADVLLDETLDLFSERPPDREMLNSLRALLGIYGGRGDPERVEELIEVWASVSKAVDLPESRSTYNIKGVEFTPEETYTLNTMRSLGYQSPGLPLKVLEYFPELNRKLETIGGIGGFFRAQMQPSRRNFAQRAAADDDHEREILRRVEGALRFQTSDPDEQASALETTLRILRELKDPEAEAGHFINLVGFYFALQGELTPELRRQGLEYARLLREEKPLRTEEDGPRSRRRPDVADRVEALAYGIWLWSDRAEASLALKDLPPQNRLRAIENFLRNLTQSRQRRIWRP